MVQLLCFLVFGSRCDGFDGVSAPVDAKKASDILSETLLLRTPRLC